MPPISFGGDYETGTAAKKTCKSVVLDLLVGSEGVESLENKSKRFKIVFCNCKLCFYCTLCPTLYSPTQFVHKQPTGPTRWSNSEAQPGPSTKSHVVTH